MARTLAITYGAVTVGIGTTDAAFNLTDVHAWSHDREKARVAFSVVITAATTAAFKTAEATFIAEMRKDDQALSVTLGGARHSYAPATNSALHVRASVSRPPDGAQSDKSGEYNVEIIATLPYDQAGRSGRRDASVQRITDASGRQVAVFRGTFTAQSGGNAALAQYTAQAATWINGVLNDFGGSWNVEGETVTFDDQDKVVVFEARYEKILHGESQAGLDHAAVVRQQLRVIRRVFGDRRSSRVTQAKPYQLVEILYRANILSSVSTSLQSLYEGTLRPHLLAQVTGAAVIVHREDLDLDPTYNVINARILARVTDGGLIESRVRVEQYNDPGKVPIPVWDGGKFSRRVYDDTAEEIVVVNVQQLAITGQGINARDAIPQALLDGDKYLLIHHNFTADDGEIGTSFGAELSVTERADVFVFLRAEPPAGGDGGGGGGGGLGEAGIKAPKIVALEPEPLADAELAPNPFGGQGDFGIQGQ